MTKIQVFILGLAIFILNDCKRGSPLRNINVKLSNGNNHWSLVKYKVNDIDSTDLINFGNYQNFKSKFFFARLESRTAGMPDCFNRLYRLNATFEDRNKVFKVSKAYKYYSTLHLFDNDSCLSSSVSDCQRNVFTPEGVETSWKIEKFKFGHFVLSCKQKNSYVLELKAN